MHPNLCIYGTLAPFVHSGGFETLCRIWGACRVLVHSKPMGTSIKMEMMLLLRVGGEGRCNTNIWFMPNPYLLTPKEKKILPWPKAVMSSGPNTVVGRAGCANVAAARRLAAWKSGTEMTGRSDARVKGLRSFFSS